MGVDLSQIAGRGPRGRIHKADVLAAAEQQQGQPAVTFQPGQMLAKGDFADLSIPLPDARVRQRVPLKGARAIIAQRMSYSASVIPHIYETIVVDAGEMIRLREKSAENVLANTGHKLTFTAILAYIISRVLPQHPYLNSSLVNEEIVLWEDVNLGLATDLGEYLIVPVVREAQHKDLRGMAQEIGRLVDAARNKKLNPDEMKNGTFTISNLGMYGIDSFTAIINPPEAAILGVGSIEESVVPGDTQGNVRQTMKLILGSDHRIVDGGKGARFLVDLKATIENPYLLF
jgi:pyruvate dehydrogenase E2 component (dihydrolipoamide acetyltransferase)